MKIDDDAINKVIEETQRKDKFNREFDIGFISKCE